MWQWGNYFYDVPLMWTGLDIIDSMDHTLQTEQADQSEPYWKSLSNADKA